MLQNRLNAFLQKQAEEEEKPQAEQPPQAETTAGNDETPPPVEEEEQPQTDPEPQAEQPDQEPQTVEEEHTPPQSDPEPQAETKTEEPKQKRKVVKVQPRQGETIPKPKNRPKTNEFIEKPPVSQEQAEKAANMVETVSSLVVDRACQYFNPKHPQASTRYKLTPTEKKELREVLAEYFKTINWALSPTAALLLGILSIYGGVILRAYMDNKSQKAKKQKADELRAKAAAIAAAEKARAEAAEKARAEAVQKTTQAPPPPVAAKPTPPPPPVQKVLTQLNEAEEVLKMRELTDGRSNFDLLPSSGGLYLKDENGTYLGQKNKTKSYKQSPLIEKKRADLHKAGKTSSRVTNKKLREYCDELRKKYGIKIIENIKHEPF